MSSISPKRMCNSVRVLCLLHLPSWFATMVIWAFVCSLSNTNLPHDLNALAYMIFLFPQGAFIPESTATLDCDERGAYRTMKSCAVRLVFSTICSSGGLWTLYMSCATLSLASIMCLALIPTIILVWSVKKLCNLWRLVFYDIKDYCQDRSDLKWGITKWIVSKWRKLSSLLHLRDRCSMKWEFVIEVGFKALSWALTWALIYFAIYITIWDKQA